MSKPARTRIVLREALAARDPALDELPWHAAWLADEPARAGDEGLAAEPGPVREAGQAGRFARRRLARVVDPKMQPNCATLAQETQAGLTRLQVRLDAFARSCDTSESASARQAGVALRFPGVDAGVRSRLVRKLSRLDETEQDDHGGRRAALGPR